MTCESAFRMAGVRVSGTQAKVVLGSLIASSPLSMGKLRKGDSLSCAKVHCDV